MFLHITTHITRYYCAFNIVALDHVAFTYTHIAAIIDLFSLYVLLPHFRPRDGTLENHCFPILKYLRAYE